MIESILRVDKQANTPLYLQLYEYFKHEINSGNMLKSEKLPSKRQLAILLQCSLNTVQAAYNQLADEGYIVAKIRSGYFVAEVQNLIPAEQYDKFMVVDEEAVENCDYDFSPHGIDSNSFPIQQWRKLSNAVICENNEDLYRVGSLQGLSSLRSSIARYLHRYRGVVCSPEQIIISSGTEYLLQLLIQIFDQDYVYAIENPGYEKLALLFNSNRAKYLPFQIDQQGIDIEQIERSAVNVACITPSHQFPMGSIMPINRRIRLLNWANNAPDRYIIEDDYDSEFRYTGKPIPSLQGLDSENRVIYLGSFSKSLTPALRISYMVVPLKLMGVFHQKMSFYACSVPAIEQEILNRFIENGYYERHLNRMRKLYRQKRESLVSAIQQMMPTVAIIGANAGLHLVLKVNNGMPEEQLIQRAKEHGVQVYGVSRYFSNRVPAEYRDVVVLGFATMNLSKITPAIALLKRAWIE